MPSETPDLPNTDVPDSGASIGDVLGVRTDNCQALDNRSDINDCNKNAAVKKFLSLFWIGGELPETKGPETKGSKP